MASRKKNTEEQQPEAGESPLLPAEEQARAMALTVEQAEVLNRIAAGRTINGKKPGVREVLGALKLKADFSLSKPAQRTRAPEASGKIYVVSPFGLDTIEVAVTQAPEEEEGEER